LGRRTEPGISASGRLGWRVGKPLAGALFRRWFSLEVGGTTIPEGPIVVAANHFSHLDPFVAGIAVGRPFRFLAVDELYGNSRVFDSTTTWLGAIPMSRTRAPLGALRLALAELAAGGSVGLFPEGVRVWTWGEVPLKRGAGWLAARAGVPLVPLAITGTDLAYGRGARRISRVPLRCTVCEPISPLPGREGSFEMMAEWRRRIDTAIAAMR